MKKFKIWFSVAALAALSLCTYEVLFRLRIRKKVHAMCRMDSGFAKKPVLRDLSLVQPLEGNVKIVFGGLLIVLPWNDLKDYSVCEQSVHLEFSSIGKVSLLKSIPVKIRSSSSDEEAIAMLAYRPDIADSEYKLHLAVLSATSDDFKLTMSRAEMKGLVHLLTMKGMSLPVEGPPEFLFETTAVRGTVCGPAPGNGDQVLHLFNAEDESLIMRIPSEADRGVIDKIIAGIRTTTDATDVKRLEDLKAAHLAELVKKPRENEETGEPAGKAGGIFPIFRQRKK